ncbi:MAG: hypothetical protein H0T62_03615 [Parachlamydiaceae bacterium]|nr:hypothetical protein [Parachlamydiaceae bacterium]
MINSTRRKIDDGCLVEVLPGEPRKGIRVNQEGQKGETCILVAMELIAKFQNTSYQMNEFMRAYLMSCQQISTKFEERASGIQFLKEKIDFSQLKEKVVLQAKIALNSLWEQSPISARSPEDVKADNALTQLTKILNDFANSDSKDFDQFINNLQYKERLDIKLPLIVQSGINPSEKFKEIALEHKFFPSFPSKLNETTFANRSHILDLIINNIWKNAFNLEYSSWNPDKPITHLMDLINNKGLQVVFGNIGRPFYNSSKIKVLQKNEKYITSGWSPGAYDDKNQVGHAVILIGAQSKGQEIVYFIDPLDESEVASPRKIYVMSYDRLCKSAMDYRGILNADIPKNDTTQRKFSLMVSTIS